MKKLNNKKGFTIVELVIVIAVIAILAAVLIPTFSTIIDKANKSSANQAATNALKIIEGDEVQNLKTYRYYFITAKNYVYVYQNGEGLKLMGEDENGNNDDQPYADYDEAKAAIGEDIESYTGYTLRKTYAKDQTVETTAVVNADLRSMDVVVLCYGQ